MTVHILDPLTDPRWAEFVERHESASVFHSVPWLEAIKRTYGYKPLVYTTTPPSAPLGNGIVLCEVHSWLTGRRIVSLPFSDHCEPLFDSEASSAVIGEEFHRAVKKGKWKYVEVRPQSEMAAFAGSAEQPPSVLHLLDISPPSEEIYKRAHKTCIRNAVKRADRAGIRYESGNSEQLLGIFYRLLIQTRRRHLVPPQPFEWFQNLSACLGNSLKVYIAYYNDQPVAGGVMIYHKKTVVFKYSASDESQSSLGGGVFLAWHAILEAKDAGLVCMDFGRTDLDNPGLIAYKERWGVKSSRLAYLRWSRQQNRHEASERSSGLLKRLVAVMPDSVLEATGRILYRHVG
ncbi:MAG TPA: GNAT family N-acetyltransferase [Terracidiphilus sp.]|nr:GNAT family N-acetyltransferase [Terracidiphilus sp.]